MKLFSKSAFKQALFCPTSLYYYYDGKYYANQNNEDDFLQALADGGNQVGDLAKVYYGVLPENDLSTMDGQDYEATCRRTRELFNEGTVTIAEAAFHWEDCFVRADIIKKEGNVVNLIEVKAKSWDKKKEVFIKGGRVNKDILEYVYDVAFQKYVIQNALGPEYRVVAHLMLADKTAKADYDGVNQFFQVVRTEDGKSRIVRGAGADVLRGHTWVLHAFDEVDAVCSDIIDGTTGEQADTMGMPFRQFVEKMSRLYVGHIREYSPVSATCFTCPFYSDEKTPDRPGDGRKECWRKMAGFSEDDFGKRSVNELWCGLLGARSLKKELVAEGKYFLSDLRESDIPPSSDVPSGLTPHERRVLQIALTTGNKAMVAPFASRLHDGIYVDVDGLRKEMENWKYPLHMIDFETTAVALPLYAGMRPYEQVAFQFSHHIISRDGSIRHAGQYLNTAKHRFPNFEFVERLKAELEQDGGTVFRYATHENTILRAIYDQLEERSYPGKDDLQAFIDSITYRGNGNKRVYGPRNMVDLLEIVRKYYYHPSMKGSNSIKVVLPAILNSSAAIQRKYSSPIYGSLIPSCNFTPDTAKAWIRYAPGGEVENPYKRLDSIASFLGVTDEELDQFDATYVPKGSGEAIANGGAALAAYTKMQFCSPAETEALAKALLRYCELDTMSMVFIWEYFHEMTGI